MTIFVIYEDNCRYGDKVVF